ncbi:unnamed protein product [Colias eurytheme]|nr:unnamed protein product [Colias eurytheme]
MLWLVVRVVVSGGASRPAARPGLTNTIDRYSFICVTVTLKAHYTVDAVSAAGDGPPLPSPFPLPRLHSPSGCSLCGSNQASAREGCALAG